MLQIEKITLKNIRTFTEATAEFTEGVNVIIGKNGAGKTTLIQAIYGSLTEFNRLAPGLKIADFIRKGATSGEIALYFSYNEDQYRIKTKLGKRGIIDQSIEKHSNTDSKWKIIAAGKQKEVKEVIEQITGTKISTLKKIVYCPQGELTDIISGKTEERKKVFKYLLDLEKYEKAKEIANNLKKAIENKIDTNNQLIQNLEKNVEGNEEKIIQDLENHKKEIKVIEKHLKELEEELFKKEKEFYELKDKKEKFDTLQGSITQQKQTLKKLTNDKKKLEIKIKNQWEKVGTKKSIEELLSEIERLRKAKENLIKDKSRIEAEIKQKENLLKELGKIRTQVQSYKSKKERILNKIKDLLGDQYSPEIQLLKQKINGMIEQEKTIKQELEEKLSNYKQELASKNAILKQKELILRENKNKINGLEEKIFSLTKEYSLENLSEELIRNKIQELNQIFEANNEEMNRVTEERGKISSELNQLDNRYHEIEEAIKLLQNTSTPKCPVCGSELNEEHKNELINKYIIELKSLRKDKIELSKKSKELKNQLDILKKQNNELETQIEELRNKREILDQIRTYEENITFIKEENLKIKEEISSINKEIKNLYIKLNELKKQITTHKNCLKKYEHALEEIIEIEKINSGLDPLLKRIKELDSLTSSELLAKLKGELEKIDHEEEVITENITAFEELLNNLYKSQDISNQIASFEEELKLNKDALFSLGFDNKKYEEVETKISNLRKEINEKSSRIKFLKNDLIPTKEKMLNEISNTKKQIDELKKQNKSLDQVRLYLTETIKLLNGLPSVITKSRLSNAQARANQIVKRFFEDRDIDGIKIGVEKYEITAIRGGLEEDIHRFSGGEQAVMAFALRVALLQEIGRINFMLLDEPTAALDRERVEEFINFLETDNPVKQLILVTHRDEFMRTASIPIEIIREKRESKITYGQ